MYVRCIADGDLVSVPLACPSCGGKETDMTRVAEDDGLSALQGKVLDLLAAADLDAEGTDAAAGRRRDR